MRRLEAGVWNCKALPLLHPELLVGAPDPAHGLEGPADGILKSVSLFFVAYSTMLYTFKVISSQKSKFSFKV